LKLNDLRMAADDVLITALDGANQTMINSNGELATLNYAAVAPDMDNVVPKNGRARCPTCQLLVGLRLELERRSLAQQAAALSSNPRSSPPTSLLSSWPPMLEGRPPWRSADGWPNVWPGSRDSPSRDSPSPRIITNSSRSIRTVCRMGSVDVHMAVEDLVQMDLGQASRLKELKVCEEMDRLFDQLQEATDCGGHRSSQANDK
jgi:hypothetical protein